jgi:glycosyltransferase involved in cell wall biosynthesis
MNIKVSVIIPVYNASKFLRRCFDSCVNQTLSEIEIIAVNDCSPDPQDSEIMREYAELHPNKFRCIWHDVNKRTGGARNTGVHIAQGEYFLCVDDDDYLDLEMCERMYAKAKLENADLAYCDYKIHQNGNIQIYSSTTIDFEKNPLTFYHAVWKTMAKKAFIEENGLYFPENVTVDDLIGYLWNLKASKIVKIDGLYYNYIIHNSNESLNHNYNFFSGIPYVFLEFSKRKCFIELNEYEKKIMFIAMIKHFYIWMHTIYIYHYDRFHEYCLECYRTFKVYENYFDKSLFKSTFAGQRLLEMVLFIEANVNCSDFAEKYIEFYNDTERNFYSKSFLSIFEQYKNHRISLWGAGDMGAKYARYINDLNIAFEITDANSEIHGKKIAENVIVRPWSDIKEHTDIVFVSAKGIFEAVRDKLSKECPSVEVVDLVELLE